MKTAQRICATFLFLGLASCSGGTRRAPAGSPAPGAPAASPMTRPAGVARNLPYTEADVHFMSGMISHHAQAVLIAGWAPSHGASDALQRLCERIVVAQRDEIELMRNWLRDRNEHVPDANAIEGHRMPGMDHPVLMPGMLTPEQLAELDAAGGREFDRLFLTYMITHHEGALTMVDDLFGSHGAAQDEVVFRFASDVFADQSTEIERMQLMLDALAGGRGSRS